MDYARVLVLKKNSHFHFLYDRAYRNILRVSVLVRTLPIMVHEPSILNGVGLRRTFSMYTYTYLSQPTRVQRCPHILWIF